MLERIIKFALALFVVVPISAIVLGQTIGPPPSSGGGASTCGSATHGICYNNGGTFASSSTFSIDVTQPTVTITGTTAASPYLATDAGNIIGAYNSIAWGNGIYFTITNTAGGGGGGGQEIGLGISNDNANVWPLLINYNGGLANGLGVIGWAADARGFNAPDTGIARSAAGVVEADTGIAGTLGTFKAAHLTATSLANSATTSAVCYNTSSGVLTYDGTIGTCNTSDARLKDIDGPIDGALQKVLAVHGIYFHYKDPGAQGKGRQIGVTAQNVERVFPELVATDSNGIKSVDYQKMIAPIIEAMREQQKEIDDLKRQLSSTRIIKASR